MFLFFFYSKNRFNQLFSSDEPTHLCFDNRKNEDVWMTESKKKSQKRKGKTLYITVKESNKSRVAQPFTKIIMLIQKYSIIATIPRISENTLFFEGGKKKERNKNSSL